jgi:hypothetical protein
LNQKLDVPAPNQVRCGDITYIWARGKWHCLAVVLDVYARRVIDWALSNKPDTNLVIKALDMAYEERGRPQGLFFARIRIRKADSTGRRNDRGVYGTTRRLDEKLDRTRSDALARCAVTSKMKSSGSFGRKSQPGLQAKRQWRPLAYHQR